MAFKKYNNSEVFEELKECFNKLDKQHICRELKKQRLELKKKREINKWLEKEQKALKNKLSMSNEIFDWAGEFKKSPIYERIEEFIDNTRSYPGLG